MITLAQVKILGDLISAQQNEQSYIKILNMLRKYVFELIETIAAGIDEVRTVDEQTMLNKLLKTYVKSVYAFSEKFPEHDPNNFVDLSISDTEV